MTKIEAENYLIRIKAAAETDDERAHGLEDEMLWKYVEFMAEFDSTARVLLSSRDIEFSRWCA